MSTPRRLIRVFPEVDHHWPLWEDTAEIVDPTPDDLGLSGDLRQMIDEWCDFYELHHHWERGWDSQENEDRAWIYWSRMIDLLRYEVAAFADISDELYRAPNFRDLYKAADPH